MELKGQINLSKSAYWVGVREVLRDILLYLGLGVEMVLVFLVSLRRCKMSKGLCLEEFSC